MRTDKADQLYKAFIGIDDSKEYALKEKLIDAIYENEQLEIENDYLRTKRDKAYEYMK